MFIHNSAISKKGRIAVGGLQTPDGAIAALESHNGAQRERQWIPVESKKTSKENNP